MHDSDEEEEQTALVCDNGLFNLLYRNILSFSLKRSLIIKVLNMKQTVEINLSFLMSYKNKMKVLISRPFV